MSRTAPAPIRLPGQRAEDALARILAAIPPASGTVVMGTGVVSIALSLDGRETLSRVLLAIDAAAWVTLLVVFAARALLDPDRVDREARSPAALSGVAGTAVLGTRLTLLGWTWASIVLLSVTAALWLILLAPALRHRTTPTVGVSLMLAVSTESLAVLAAAVAHEDTVRWLLDAALVPFALGLGFYAVVISHFDLRQLVVGRGDHWITGGALAIATLAAGGIALGAESIGGLGALAEALEDTSLILWGLSIAWLPVLLAAEALRPRPGYEVRRWSTVFPVGMYAAASFIVGNAATSSVVTSFARVWVWVGLAVWLVVFAAMSRRGLRLARGR
jgi:tellurite resistance protein TehA-like permease